MDGVDLQAIALEAFPKALKKAGVTFIGPNPDVIKLMGLKQRAREAMRPRREIAPRPRGAFKDQKRPRRIVARAGLKQTVQRVLVRGITRKDFKRCEMFHEGINEWTAATANPQCYKIASRDRA